MVSFALVPRFLQGGPCPTSSIALKCMNFKRVRGTGHIMRWEGGPLHHAIVTTPCTSECIVR